MKTSGIYIIKCISNDSFYIGSAKNCHKRWVDHKSAFKRGKHSNIHFQRIYDKYGEASFSFEILEAVEIDILLSKEQEYLDMYFENPNCVNISKDSFAPARGLKCSEEHKRKISLAHKGIDRPHKYLPRTEETKRKISEYNKTKRIYKPHTEATKQLISNKKKGVKMTEEAKINMSVSRKKSWESEDFRRARKNSGIREELP